MKTTGFLLASYSQRTLQVLAGTLSGKQVSVTLSTRLVRFIVIDPLRLHLYLHPARCTLFDLAVVAMAMRNLRKLRKLLDDSQAARVAFVRETISRLIGDFPGVTHLSGILRKRPGDLSITLDSIELAPLTATDINRMADDGASGVMSGGAIAGNENDIRAITKAISRGRYPVETYPPLQPMDVATIPIRIDVGQKSFIAQQKRWIEDKECVSEVAGYLSRCYQRKIESRPLDNLSRLSHFGIQLSSKRLHDAYVSCKIERPAEAFRTYDQSVADIFDPSQHLAIVAFDVSSMNEGTLRPSWRILSACARSFIELGADTMIVAFMDRVLRINHKRSIYLHCPVIIKEVDEPVGEMVWARIEELRRSAEALFPNIQAKHDSACFQPLQYRTIGRYVSIELGKRAYRYVAVSYLGTGNMGHSPMEPEQSRNVAKALEKEIEAIQGIAEYSLESGLVIIPKWLKDNSSKGGSVQDMWAFDSALSSE